MSDDMDMPHFIQRLTGVPIRSKTDEGAVLELMHMFGMAPAPPGPPRDFDAEAEALGNDGDQGAGA